MIAQLDLRAQRTTRVVLKTDSDYLHKSMMDWMSTWLKTGGVGSVGREVEHWKYLLALHARIDELEKAKGIQVKFWWVPREYNGGADELANQALDRGDSAYGSF